jgi:hypothetical protein
VLCIRIVAVVRLLTQFFLWGVHFFCSRLFPNYFTAESRSTTHVSPLVKVQFKIDVSRVPSADELQQDTVGYL